jgi:hypothetical protein
MEAAENHASHNLAVLGKGMFVVILQRREYRGTFRNPRSEAQMRAPLVVRVDNATPITLLSGRFRVNCHEEVKYVDSKVSPKFRFARDAGTCNAWLGCLSHH